TEMTRRVKSLTEIIGVDPESDELITNSAYTWNPAEDSFNFSGHSYVYEKIQTARNWTPKRMEQEVKRRLELFQYMERTGVKSYRDVARIASAYYKDPEEMIGIVRAELSEE
ncbi:MAG: secretion system protein E, partial [Thermoplasmata archaeon]